MSHSALKRRIRALEDKAGGSDSMIVFAHTTPGDAPAFAAIVGGPSTGSFLYRQPGEDGDAFDRRVHELADQGVLVREPKPA